MTTIAWDGHTLAADTLATSGDIREGFAIKIAKKANVLAAGSGSLSLVKALLDWFRSGMIGDAPPLKVGEYEAIFTVIHPDGQILTWTPCGIELVYTEYLTMGSGWLIAKGALMAGCNAVQAVEIAIRCDTESGGRIVTLTR